MSAKEMEAARRVTDLDLRVRATKPPLHAADTVSSKPRWRRVFACHERAVQCRTGHIRVWRAVTASTVSLSQMYIFLVRE